MRRAAIRVGAALAAAAVVVATAGPARAGGPLGGGDIHDPWVSIPCTSGAVDRAELDTAEEYLTLEWHLDCAAPADAPARHGYARYQQKLGGEARGLGYYAPTAPTRYARGAHLPDSVDAICAVTANNVRVACVKVERDPVSRAPLAVRPLPTDDPLVDTKVSYNPGVESSPACGGCW